MNSFPRHDAITTGQTRKRSRRDKGFTDTDLLGRWNILFGNENHETLLLNDDNTFVQTFTSTDYSSLIYTEKGAWRIERDPSGCTYVYLEGMRYFYNTISIAENGNRLEPDGKLYNFIDKCLKRTITMPDKVILIVIEEPRTPRNIALLFPKAGVEDPDIALYLIADNN